MNDFEVRNMSNFKNKQTLRKPVWQDILFRTCMEVRFITAVTRGFFFSLEVVRYPVDHAKGKKNPLAPRVTRDMLQTKNDRCKQKRCAANKKRSLQTKNMHCKQKTIAANKKHALQTKNAVAIWPV